jgi:hypothetical protein
MLSSVYLIYLFGCISFAIIFFLNYCLSRKFKPIENDKFNHLINVLILPLTCGFKPINQHSSQKFKPIENYKFNHLINILTISNR